jgi:subfamily B ATP-binding cassette protein MsbA
MSHRNKNHPTHGWPLTKRLIRSYVKPHLRTLGVAFFFMAVAAAMTASLAKLMEPVIDKVFRATDESALYQVAGALFFAFVVRGLATYAHMVMMNRMGQRILATVQNQMLGHILKSDLAFFHAHPSGQLLSRMVNDVGVMRMAVAESLTSFGKSTLTLVFLVGVMFYQDWRLACIAFVAFPAGAWFVAKLGKRLRRVATDTQSELAHFSAQLTQMFQGARHVKAYGAEGYESARFSHIIERMFKFTHRGFRIGALSTPVNEIFSAVAIVTVIIYGGYQVMEGARTPGALFSFITAFLLAYEPMKRLGKVNAQMQAGLSAADRVFEVLDTMPQVLDRPHAKPLTISRGEVVLNNVTFGYAADAPVLRGVSITAPAGKTIALVGSSGAGKTTVLNLIPRFYDVTDGHVAIDGQDVRDVTVESLRAHIALVSQDIVLFDDTVRNNIRYGRQSATEDEVMAAAKAAQAHDFILSLPNGYDTMIGELGAKISGGQRQRLVIARAMLKNAPILLLDEATSALDSESEKGVQAALKQLQQGRTTIVIAHRLSTIQDADCIYVMDSGRVIEQGTHAELLARRGAYSKLYGSLAEVESQPVQA